MKSDNKKFNEVVTTTIIFNILLSFFKMIAGIFGKSQAMISDAIHSLSDVFSTLIVIVGVKISKKEADSSHPYGHERFESIASMVLAFILFITAFTIGYNGLITIIEGKSLETPTFLALALAIISIMIKEGMFWYTKIAAKRLESSSLMADAWHHRSDALSSVGSMIGIIGSMLGVKILDPLASIIICLFIFKVAVDIFIEATKEMTDHSCSISFTNEVVSFVLAIAGVIEIDSFKSRMFGNKAYLDIEISIDKNLSFEDAHMFLHLVHDTLEENFPKIKHCTIHVNPYIPKKSKKV